MDAPTAPVTDPPDALPEEGWCWKCGYDLRGLGEPRCPECGFRFELGAVRELNTIWVGERITGFQFANLVQALAAAIAILALIGKRGVADLMRVFVPVVILFVPIYGLVMLRRVMNSLTGPSANESPSRMRNVLNRTWTCLTDSCRCSVSDGNATRSSSGRTAFPPWAAHGIILFVLCAPLIIWPLALLIALFAGLLLFGLEFERDREGRRRHHLYGVDPDGVASLDFARRVSIFLACVSVVAITAVLATQF